MLQFDIRVTVMDAVAPIDDYTKQDVIDIQEMLEKEITSNDFYVSNLGPDGTWINFSISAIRVVK